MQSQSAQEMLVLALVALFSLLLRLPLGLHPYSGMHNPPAFGDYEAQRHWMEITTNLPVQDWYRDTPDNDLQYWGLDYPPLSAYQSWLYGKAIGHFDPNVTALHSSRGYESPFSKALMRWSVTLSDIVVFLPAAIASVLVFARGRAAQQKAWLLLVVLMQPAALLIDHGHFQYNNISLGLTAGAAAAVAADWDLVGSALFCLAVNHKQMAMYFAPAFFAHLLGKCMRRPGLQKVSRLLLLGMVVVLTFMACWAPWLHSRAAAASVLQRVAPVRRGLFEDYVANFWCTSSLLVKWRRLYDQQVLIRLCAAATLLGCLPSMLQQALRPSPAGLLRSMANCALSAFLFSYQVHEKSILLPLLPVTLLALEHSALAAWMPAVGAFSMWPLLKKDGLGLAYVAILMLWAAIVMPSRQQMGAEQQRQPGKLLAACCAALSCLAGLALHTAERIVTPPERYAFIYDAAFVTLSFAHFAALWLYLNWQQWSQAGQCKSKVI